MNKVVVAEDAIDLRRGVDYIGVGALFVIHDGKGNILLQKRSRNARDEHGRWANGAGALEFGEKLEDALRREIKEEILADALEVELLESQEVLRNNRGKLTHWMVFLYAVRVNPKKVGIGEPHKIDEIGWFNSKNLPEPLHSQFYKSFEIVKDRGFVN